MKGKLRGGEGKSNIEIKGGKRRGVKDRGSAREREGDWKRMGKKWELEGKEKRCGEEENWKKWEF